MYISGRFFSHTVEYEDKIKTIKNYSGKEWEHPKNFLSGGRKITASSLKISAVIKNKLGIELFPLIIKVACKGFDIGGGSAAFLMYGKDGKQYYFEDRASRYKSLAADYNVIDYEDGHNWICRI